MTDEQKKMVDSEMVNEIIDLYFEWKDATWRDDPMDDTPIEQYSTWITRRIKETMQ